MFKPLLAPNQDPLSYPSFFDEIRYPLLASPKLDGIRCIVKGGVCLSRSGKPLPSAQVQESFSVLEHFDGELIEGNVTDYGVYNRTQSHVMSEDKPGNLTFYAFDYTDPELLRFPFEYRYGYLLSVDFDNKTQNFIEGLEVIPHSMLSNYAELLAYESKCLESGYEGIMLRNPYAPYKNGRATWKEGIIYKLKRFKDDEGVVVDLEEQMTNNNVQERSELGYAKRSSSMAGLVAADTLGNFVVAYGDDYISVAPGAFTHIERKRIWDNRERYLGKILKFRYFAHGIKEKPRFPRAVGFRDKEDM